MAQRSAPDDTLSQLGARTATLRAEVEARVTAWAEGVRDAAAFRQAELDMHAIARGFADDVTGLILAKLTTDGALQAEALRAARTGDRKMVHGGTRSVEVRLLGGGSAKVHVEYLREGRQGQPGRKRGIGRRGRAGAGVYPVLSALGVAFGATPALVAEICRQVADSDSVRAGRAALDRRGIDLGHKQTLRIVNHFAHRAVAQRNAWLEQQREAPPTDDGPLRGRRVVVSMDGGRIRERVPKRGRRTKSGHHRYSAPWREPKLIVIYVIDEKGRVEEEFRPVYDGTLEDCDALFDMLVGYLRALGVHEAQEVVIVGDGALWIWGRTALLAEKIGLPFDRMREVVDWYHAVEKLGEVAALPGGWSSTDRAKWLEHAKSRLYVGDIEEVAAQITGLAVGRRAKAVKEHIDYFRRNSLRMQYSTFEKAQVPIGSGSVESSIRRIVNMRMKGNGTFWKAENAEGMLMLRSYLKANRFDDLVDWSNRRAASWWPHHVRTTSPIVEPAVHAQKGAPGEARS